MESRTLENVLEEFRTETHLQMVLLIETLRNKVQGEPLKYDVSMLRLWIARKNASDVQVMVAYGDGRGGGRPVATELDSYELTIFASDSSPRVSVQDLSTTITLIRDWFK